MVANPVGRRGLNQGRPGTRGNIAQFLFYAIMPLTTVDRGGSFPAVVHVTPTAMRAEIDSYLRYLQEERFRTTRTVANYRAVLEGLARHIAAAHGDVVVPVGEVDRADIVAFAWLRSWPLMSTSSTSRAT